MPSSPVTAAAEIQESLKHATAAHQKKQIYNVNCCTVVAGGGKRFLPEGVRLNLELVEERRFGSGVVVP
jgi:hypothetical protein